MPINRTRRMLGITTITAIALAMGWIVVAPRAATAADTSLCLEVSREVSAAVPAVGGQVSLTARLVTCTDSGPPNSASATGGNVNIDFWAENGVAAAGDKFTPTASCNTLPSAPPATPYPQCSVVIGDLSQVPGSSEVRAWIDHDGNNATFEADPLEGRLSDANRDCVTELPPPAGTGAADGTDYSACTSTATDAVTPGKRTEPDDTDVVRIWFSPASQTATEVTCKNVIAPAGADAHLPCTLTDQAGVPIAGKPIDAEHMGGANDPNRPNGAAASTSANYQDGGKVTGPDGGFDVIVGGSRGDLGPGTICAWFDSDKSADDNPITPDASYKHNNTGAAGDGGNCQNEVDGVGAPSVRATNITGLGTVEWQDRAPTTIDLTPESESAVTGTSKSVTATVNDQFGAPYTAQSVSVRFEFFSQSPNDPDGTSSPGSADRTCTTSTTGNDAGTCTFSYTGNVAGTDTICGWIGSTPSITGSSCGGEPANGTDNAATDVVTKTFAAQTAATTTTTTTPPAESAAKDQGYYLVGGDGGIFNFGNAGFHGSLGDKKLNQPIIGMASRPGGDGYWLVAKDGGIFAFGSAPFKGSLGDTKLNAPILGMEPTITGNGYWLFGADGGIFSFGDAVFRGSMGDQKLNAPMIGMAVTAKGDGYWLVAQDGGVFTFNAPFYGSTGNKKLNQPVFDMAPMPNDAGYWLVARDGGIFTFPESGAFYGSGVGAVAGTVIGMGPTPSGKGYWIGDNTGKVVPRGDALFLGDRATAARNAPFVGFTVVPKA
jgi:hypothetical protein